MLVGLALAVVLVLTLSPARPYGGLNPIATRPSGLPGLLDLAGNVLLFVPLGFALAARGVRFTTIVASGLACSAAIEALQVFVPGRYPTLSDLVTNTTGSAAGGVAFLLARRPAVYAIRALLAGFDYVAHPGPRLAPWLLAVASLLPATGGLCGAVLAIPSAHDGTLIVAPSALDATDRLYVGSSHPGLSFCGSVDEVRVYARALSPTELAADRNRPVAAASADGLVASLGFEDLGNGVEKSDPAVRLVGADRIADGRFGAAVRLRSADARVAIGPSDALRLDTGLTLSAWVRPDRPDCGPAVVDTGESSYFLHAGSRSNPLRPYGGGRFAKTYVSAASGVLIPEARWTFLALTYDGEQLLFYLDGELKAIRTIGTRALRHVDLGGRQVPPGSRLPAPAWPWDAAPPMGIVLDHRQLAAPGTLHPLLRLVTYGREALGMEARRGELRIRYASRFERFGAAPVEYRFPEALGAVPPPDLRVTVGGPRLRGYLRVGDGAVQSFGLTPAAWWTRLMYAQEIPAFWRWAGTLVVAAAMAFPLGYYARTARFGPVWVLAPLPAVWGVVAIVPMLGPSVSEAAFGLAGFAAGWALRRRTINPQLLSASRL